MTTGAMSMGLLARLRHAFTLPRGFVADGRALGLGLATALAAQRANQPSDEEIERFLRRHAGPDRDAHQDGDLVRR